MGPEIAQAESIKKLVIKPGPPLSVKSARAFNYHLSLCASNSIALGVAVPTNRIITTLSTTNNTTTGLILIDTKTHSIDLSAGPTRGKGIRKTAYTWYNNNNLSVARMVWVRKNDFNWACV